MSIRYRGEISQADFMHGFVAHYRPLPNGLALRGFVLIAVLAASVWAGLSGTDPVILGLGLLAVVSIVAMPWWLPVFLARNAWAARAASGPEEGTITAAGIHCRQAGKQALLPWANLHSYRAFADVLLLYHAGNVYNILPRALFAHEGDWRAALELVAAHLPERSRTRKPTWGLWVAVVGLVVLGAALALLMQGR
jgi:hypothetical protein